MKIAIDVDDVLFPLNEGFLKFHNKKYHTNIKTFEVWDVFKVLGCTKEEAVKRYHEYFETESLESTKPLEFSQEAIEKLKQKHELVIVTSRPEFMKEKTLAWLNKHFPNTFNENTIYFTNRCNFHEETKTTKLAICKEINAELLIDDCLNYILECKDGNVKTILFGNYGWNQHNNKDLVRVNNWREALENIENM